MRCSRLEHALVLVEGGAGRAQAKLGLRLIVDQIVARDRPEIMAARIGLGRHEIVDDDAAIEAAGRIAVFLAELVRQDVDGDVRRRLEQHDLRAVETEIEPFLQVARRRRQAARDAHALHPVGAALPGEVGIGVLGAADRVRHEGTADATGRADCRPPGNNSP